MSNDLQTKSPNPLITVNKLLLHEALLHVYVLSNQRVKQDLVFLVILSTYFSQEHPEILGFNGLHYLPELAYHDTDKQTLHVRPIY